MSDLQDAKFVSPRLVIFITRTEDQTNLTAVFQSLRIPMLAPLAPLGLVRVGAALGWMFPSSSTDSP